MKKLIQEDLEKRVGELLAFAKEKEIFISAVQQINRETGYIEVVPLYRNLKQYPQEDISNPSPEEFLPEKNA